MTAQNRSFLAVAIAASAVFALGLGIRNAQPLFISAVNSSTGVGYVALSLAFGIAQLVWGMAQPVAGAVADRFGPRPVMLAGAILIAGATAAIPLAHSALALTLLIGVAGWQPALVMLGATGLLAIPLIAYLTRGSHATAHPGAAATGSLRDAVRAAANDRSYLLLNAGFFTCGFHVAFIATHLPGYVATCQQPPSVAAWSLGIIGLFNIAGSLWVGRAIAETRMKLMLAAIYFARALLILVFFFSPKTELAFFLFAAGIGFTYLSTVPPTVGLVAKLHGPRYLATLFGIVMLSHQVGGFLGAWLGGKAYAATGSYDWMWWADIGLCLMAAAVHLPIREARRLALAAA